MNARKQAFLLISRPSCRILIKHGLECGLSRREEARRTARKALTSTGIIA